MISAFWQVSLFQNLLLLICTMWIRLRYIKWTHFKPEWYNQSTKEEGNTNQYKHRVSRTIRFFTYALKCQLWHFVFTMWKQKNSSDNLLPPVRIEPGYLKASDCKSNTILSALTWNGGLRRSLNFGSCTTGYLDFDDFRGINRAWPFKDPKVSVQQANVKLV